MKPDKRLYTFFQIRNTINYDYMKKFDVYVKVVESYGGKTPIHPGLVKSKLTNMGVQDIKNPTPEEK